MKTLLGFAVLWVVIGTPGAVLAADSPGGKDAPSGAGEQREHPLDWYGEGGKGSRDQPEDDEARVNIRVRQGKVSDVRQRLDEQFGPDERPTPEEDEALEAIRANAPEVHEELSRARRMQPRGFRKQMREFMPMMRDPDMRQVLFRNMRAEMKLRRMGEEYKGAEGARKDELKKGIETALSEQFDAKLQAHETRLKKMREEIVRLESRIDKRRKLKDQILKKRLGELSGDVEAWEW